MIKICLGEKRQTGLLFFEGCILLRLLLQSFLGSVNRNCTFRMFYIITIIYPLHVSALLQVEYTYK
jgi:hypothetical protein